MGNSLAKKQVIAFLTEIGKTIDEPAEIYLLGGSALTFLGNARRTIDIDISIINNSNRLQNALQNLPTKIKLTLNF